MSLYPAFSLHLDRQPFEPTIVLLPEHKVCVLKIGAPGSHPMEPLALFFPFEKQEQVQRIADALNEIGTSISAASNPLAA